MFHFKASSSPGHSGCVKIPRSLQLWQSPTWLLCKEMRFTPDRCPCGEPLKTLPALHQCLRGGAAAIVLSVPRGAWAAATEPKCCPCCHVPSITAGGTGSDVVVDSPGVTRPLGLLHPAPGDPLQDGQGWKPTLQLLVANDAFIIKAGSLAALVGINPVLGSAAPRCPCHPQQLRLSYAAASLERSMITAAPWATKTQRGPGTPFPISRTGQQHCWERVKACC